MYDNRQYGQTPLFRREIGLLIQPEYQTYQYSKANKVRVRGVDNPYAKTTHSRSQEQAHFQHKIFFRVVICMIQLLSHR